LGKTPNPKELFRHNMFKAMAVLYLVGFIVFIAGILSGELLLLRIAASLLIGAAILYNGNIYTMLSHTPLKP
jgi:hypothetical protein